MTKKNGYLLKKHEKEILKILNTPVIKELDFYINNLNKIEFSVIRIGELINGFSAVYCYLRFEEMLDYYYKKSSKCKSLDDSKNYLKVIPAIINKKLMKLADHLNYFLDSKTIFSDLDKKLNKYEDLKREMTEKTQIKKLDEYLRYKIIDALSKEKESCYRKLKFIKEFEQYYTNKRFLQIDFKPRFENEMITYKGLFLESKIPHEFVISYNNLNDIDKIGSFINVLSYLNQRPIMYQLNNRYYREKLSDYYAECDILDLLRIRHKNFFKDNHSGYLGCEEMLLEYYLSEYKLIKIPEINHEELFELYTASLKQLEPFSKCIFLYRVFEKGCELDYKKKVKPNKFKSSEALDYYIEKIKTYNFIPRFYTYSNKNFKIEMKNLMLSLKSEIEKIEKEWKEHNFLSKYSSLGEIIYVQGRNPSAHGGGRFMRYDYSDNYKHINNVNIFLELIARYIIEILNPDLSKIVIKDKKNYEINSYFFKTQSYKKK